MDLGTSALLTAWLYQCINSRELLSSPSEKGILLQSTLNFLTDRGILLTSGIGSSGSLGHGNTSDVAQLRIVESLLGVSVKQVACGSAHVVAVSVDHQVYAWGCGSNGK